MKKEILIYSGIYSWTVADIITRLEEAKDSDIRCRVNSPGGEVYYAYGLIAKYMEHTKNKQMQVDGIAASAAAFLCCCSDETECLDVSTFLFHRAAFPSWIENDPEYFTESRRSEITKINKDLRAIMEGKFTAELWQKVTGVSLDDLFSLESRMDVTLDAKQAKKLGLVNKINSITPEKKAEIESLVMGIAALSIPKMPETEREEPTTTIIKNPNKKMTLQEIKAQHPDVCKAIYDEGVAAERDRVESYMEFADVDPVAVKAGISAGKAITAKEMAGFSRKAIAQATIGNMQAENAPDVTTEEAEKGTTEKAKADAKATADFDKEWKAQAGVKTTV
ncbi:MAG: ATP-dependent Clp protease proteolytic subunit [Taibaiella sp.]